MTTMTSTASFVLFPGRPRKLLLLLDKARPHYNIGLVSFKNIGYHIQCRRRVSHWMRPIPIFTVCMLVILILVWQPQVVRAQSVLDTPAMLVSISNGATSVSIVLQASQNLTSQDRLFSLPQFNGQLIGQNASTVSSIVQDSIRAFSPRASVSNLRLSLSSSPP